MTLFDKNKTILACHLKTLAVKITITNFWLSDLQTALRGNPSKRND